MKRSKYSECQIVSILKEAENGVPLEDLMRQHGFSKGSSCGGFLIEWAAPGLCRDFQRSPAAETILRKSRA